MRSFRFDVRMVAALCAAGLLTVLPVPPARSAEPLKLEALTVQKLQTLPAATRVTFRQRQTTVGVLRAEHAARLQRFAQASSLGAKYRFTPGATAAHRPLAPSTAQAGTKVLSATPAPPGSVLKAVLASPTPRPIDLSKLDFTTKPVPPLTNIAIGFTPAKDYTDFCTATGAAACMYLPASTTLWADVKEHALYDIDGLIQDPNVCSSMGGTYQQTGSLCIFKYPQVFLGNFVPGSAAKGPTTFTTNCPSTVTVETDVKGAIKITIPVPQIELHTGAATSLCVVNALTPT